MSEEEYQRFCPNQPFEVPQFSENLVIPRGTETADALNLREEHRNSVTQYYTAIVLPNTAQYREYREVEKA